LDAAAFEPYFGGALNATIASALLNAKGNLAVSQAKAATKASYRGDLAVVDVRMLDKASSDPFATVETAPVTVETGSAVCRLPTSAVIGAIGLLATTPVTALTTPVTAAGAVLATVPATVPRPPTAELTPDEAALTTPVTAAVGTEARAPVSAVVALPRPEVAAPSTPVTAEAGLTLPTRPVIAVVVVPKPPATAWTPPDNAFAPAPSAPE
ncbi:DUF748 domain-containing protein, partial [Burkholderia gladioli]|nr:DUF748 domain-containing protein [Burkholderia gladioli]